jgi:hypothetical protein
MNKTTEPIPSCILDDLGRYRETEEAIEQEYEATHVTIPIKEYKKLLRIKEEWAELKELPTDLARRHIKNG